MKENIYRKKEEIESWLNHHKITNYEIIKDKKYGYVVNVNNDINLYEKKLDFIPVKFNEVHGSIFASNNNISDLTFLPSKIFGSLYLGFNKLENLKGFPEFIEKDINLQNNKLTSLVGLQEEVFGFLDVQLNSLKNLKGAPKKIKGDFSVAYNYLTTLKYCPLEIGGDLQADTNEIINLDYFPSKIYGNIYLQNNPKEFFNNPYTFSEILKEIKTEESINLMSALNMQINAPNKLKNKKL